MKKRIHEILAAMKADTFERDDAMALSLLSALSGESIFLLGLPGVGKSMMARRLKLAFKDARVFEYLMSRFSTPDEIFGPVSISKLTGPN
ncbi:MAG: AAA family ATPase, partial [Muribaculaceae bacterium]|nr:AAA family ATPase [Muribaculaceae bacterium]